MEEITGIRNLSEEDRLLRIAEMFGVLNARGAFKDLPGYRDLPDRLLFERWVDLLSFQDRGTWLTEYDFITKPFTVHLIRIYPKLDSTRIPKRFGDWELVQEGTLPDGQKTAYKLQRDVGKGFRRVGWFDEEIRTDAERAVVVVRWSERLIEVRASYSVARKMVDILVEAMNLEDAKLVDFTAGEYGLLLEQLNAEYEEVTVDVQGPDAAALTLRTPPDRRMSRSREFSLELEADGLSPAVRIESSAMTKESGWMVVTIGNRLVRAQVYRKRGTFSTQALIREGDVDLLVKAIKTVKGYDAGTTAAD